MPAQLSVNIHVSKVDVLDDLCSLLGCLFLSMLFFQDLASEPEPCEQKSEQKERYKRLLSLTPKSKLCEDSPNTL